MTQKEMINYWAYLCESVDVDSLPYDDEDPEYYKAMRIDEFKKLL